MEMREVSVWAEENAERINIIPHYHQRNPHEDNDLSNFVVDDILAKTFCDRLADGSWKLTMKGNELVKSMGRRLTDADVGPVLRFIAGHPRVTWLNLAYNRITDDGMEEIVDFLKSDAQKIVRLNLVCNDIGARGVAALAALGAGLRLEELRINGNKFGVEGGKVLAELLTINKTLLLLDVGETDQTLSTLVQFTAALRSDAGRNDTLRILDLSRPNGQCTLGFDWSGHFADTVGKMLTLNAGLSELHLQKHGFTDHDLERLVDALYSNHVLRHLDLACNYIGCDGAGHLARFLKTRPALFGLSLAHNRIGDTGARALSFTLPSSRIKQLDLSYNQLTDDGVLDLLNSIKKKVPLRKLFIWGAAMTVRSCKTMLRMLASGVLSQSRLDVKPYRVDGQWLLAYNHVDRFNHIYYCVGDYGHPPPRTAPRTIPSTSPIQVTFDHVPCFAVPEKYLKSSPQRCVPQLDVSIECFAALPAEYFRHTLLFPDTVDELDCDAVEEVEDDTEEPAAARTDEEERELWCKTWEEMDNDETD